jgi:hypothetical protein
VGFFKERRERHAAAVAAQRAATAEMAWQADENLLRQEVEMATGFRGIARDDLAAEGAHSPVAIKANERVILIGEGNAALIEPRRGPGHYSGASQGVSVRVPGTRSMRYRVGATRGTYVQGDETPTPIDNGQFVITTTRTVFVGPKQTREWAWAKLVGIEHHVDPPWTSIAVENRQKVSGILYDASHERYVQFCFDLASAIGLGTVDEFAADMRAQYDAHLAARPAEIAAPPPLALEAPGNGAST